MKNARALVISPEVQAAVDKVKAYAQEHPFNVHDIHRLLAHPENAHGNTPGFVVVIPLGYRCVFTIEQQPHGWMRHVSVSVGAKGRIPSVPALIEILKMFGFKKPLYDCVVHVMEEQVDSVNVLELLDDGEPKGGH